MPHTASATPEPAYSRAYGDHPDQVFDVFQPDRPGSRTVIVIHGGFWRPEYDRMHARAQARALADLGFTTVLPEYRRIPGAPDAGIEDLLRVVDLLGVPRPIVIGHSAGGHLALLVAQRRQTGAVLSLGGVVDLALAEHLDLGAGAVRDYLGGPVADRPDLDPAQGAPPEGPVFLVHGTDDTDVPIAVSEGLAVRWSGSCRLIRLEGTGHMELIEPTSSAWPTVVELLSSADA